MLFVPPGEVVADTAFRDETVDMRIPFEVSAKGMQNTDKAGSKELRFIIFVEQTGNDAVHGGKEVVEKGTVIKEERTQFVGNGEDTMPVRDIDDLKRHRSSPVNGVHVAAGRTET